jgi:RNA polymerase-binding transcription factor DksA
MPAEKVARPDAITLARTHSPQWRALLESRWRARLREVTELSLAYHAAAAAPGSSGDHAARQTVQVLASRTVAARRKLADIDEALGRLAAGTFGFCEQCGAEIPAGLLTSVPETRYCPRCDAPYGAGLPRHDTW